MLTPRFPRARRLVLWSCSLVWLGMVAAAGIGGCQGPDTFLRKDGTGGVGGSGFGGFIGLGGSIGLGGFIGLGGSPGIGGTPGAGGGAMGGRAGTGGTGGTVVAGTGGAPGAGGRDGGAPDVAGGGGRAGTGGAPGMDAGNDVGGGTGPCAGLCANPITPPVATPTSVQPTGQGPDATCYEVVGNFQGGNCGNFVAPRTLSINGVVVPICSASTSGGNFNLPATRINGGYCFQATAGQYSYAYFGLF